jgi:ferric-dicitrate binding protein FerR (iron transport regulator)
MKHQEKNLQASLEDAVRALRGEQPEAEAMQSAGERVWQRLRQERETAQLTVNSIRGCDDVRALLPQFRLGQLAPPRALLVEAHLQECVGCRHENEKAKRAVAALKPWQHALPRVTNDRFRWVMAAVALVIVGIGTYFVQDRFFSSPAGMRARVESFNGVLYRVGLSVEQSLKAGDELGEGERVRTGGGSRAVLRLGDGSVVEMNERAEFGVSMRGSDTTVQLRRGNIIVQAAKRQTGHLYVAAPDCRVSVTGTVFAVNSGIKGSRVSVIEGEVRVAASGATSVLHPGDQLSTNAAVAAVPVKQEIAWSQNLDQHLALLAAFAHLENKLEAVQMPGLRYQSKLLPLLPRGTIVYASIPNLGDAAQQAYLLFQQELQESQVLRDWWQKAQAKRKGPSFQEVIDEVHTLSQFLGAEIVFSVALNGEQGSPLVIAQVQRPGLKEYVSAEISRHSGSERPYTQVVDEQGLRNLSRSKGLLILVTPDFVAASESADTLRNFDAAAKQGGSGFVGTPFGQRMAAAYQGGAGLLFGADLQAMTTQHASVRSPRSQEAFEYTGLADVQYLIAERKEKAGQVLNQAELSFNGPRRGMASWLAAPAPIGGLSFVSQDAAAVGAFVAKSPAQMVDDVFNLAYATSPNAKEDIARSESELKISYHQDLADTLGGEITFALDGPLLPTPAWKVIAEVYNPGRLQSTIEQLVADANEHNADHPERQVRLEQESVNGLIYYRLHFEESGKSAEVDYTFTDGYLVIGPSRALVMAALNIHQHQSDNSLASSSAFRALLPQDEHANVSALLYQNLAPVVGPVMQQLTPSQLQSLQQLAKETKPSVVCAYGEDNAVRVASNSRFFGLDLNTLTLSALLRLTHPPGSGRTD